MGGGLAVGLLVVAVALLLVGCEKPDASYSTSPAVKALIGTTTGNVSYDPPEAPPEPKDPPDKWALQLSLASFQELENGHPSLEVVLDLTTHEGAGMELWLVHDQDGKTTARWSAGSSAFYEGTACFQLELQNAGEAVPLVPGSYHLVVAFRDVESGIVMARSGKVTAPTPVLHGTTPAPGSKVYSEALACRRGG